MSKKDYVKIAELVANTIFWMDEEQHDYEFVSSICKPWVLSLKEDNSRFDAERFINCAWDRYYTMLCGGDSLVRSLSACSKKEVSDG